MTPRDLARLYFEKAKEDVAAANALASNPNISDAIIGFHCQQAIEKYLKALLAIQEKRVRRVHDLAGLIDQLRELGIKVPAEFDDAADLTPFSVLARYPVGHEPEPLNRAEALKLIKRIGKWAEENLGA